MVSNKKCTLLKLIQKCCFKIFNTNISARRQLQQMIDEENQENERNQFPLHSLRHTSTRDINMRCE